MIAHLSPVGMFHLVLMGISVDGAMLQSSSTPPWLYALVITCNLICVWLDGRALRTRRYTRKGGAFWWRVQSDEQ